MKRDEVLGTEIRAVHAENYSAFGARKMHVMLNRPLVAERHGQGACRPLRGGAPHALDGAEGPPEGQDGPIRRAARRVSSALRTSWTVTSRRSDPMRCGWLTGVLGVFRTVCFGVSGRLSTA